MSIPSAHSIFNGNIEDDDEDHLALTIEEIAAEAHKHRRPAAATSQQNKTANAPTVTLPNPPTVPPASENAPPHHNDETTLDEPHHDDYDDALLHQAVADAGRWAYGTVLVEVWVKRGTTLIRPQSGWWVDPVYHVQPCDHATCQICRLTDASRHDYVPPAALVPGEGLPGVLWTELERGGTTARGGGGGGGGGTTRIMRAISLEGTNTTRRGGGGGTNTAGRASTRGIFGQIQQFHQERQGEISPGGPMGKRLGHRRAVTSTDDFVSVPVGSAEGQASRSVSERGGNQRRRGHGRAVTSVDNSIFVAAVAAEEVREMTETPVVVPSVAWRDVKSLAADPDQPWNPRLQLLAACNLGWAAAVPLRRHGQAPHGLVIYMARSGVDGIRLRSPTNEAYLTSAADLIASALFLRGPRHAAIQERQAELHQTIVRVRRRILFLLRTGHGLQDIVNGNTDLPGNAVPISPGAKSDTETALRPDDWQLAEFNPCFDYMSQKVLWFRSKLWKTLLKTRGGAVQPPPAFSLQQTFHTFVSVFLTIAAMCWLNTHLISSHGRDALLLLGPFGALVTLLFGLTAAPASQPRNAMMGQTVSIGIVLLLQYIPGWEEMSLEWRASLSTALAVAAMVRLGYTHPPAGAASFLFALAPKSLRGSHLGVLLLGNVICIGMSTVLNNWSDRKQYPTFWGIQYTAQYRQKQGGKVV